MDKGVVMKTVLAIVGFGISLWILSLIGGWIIGIFGLPLGIIIIASMMTAPASRK